MQPVAIAVPINQGKTDAWVHFAKTLATQWRHEIEVEFRTFGIHRETAWLQRTIQGDMAILLWEIEDPELHRQQFLKMMGSKEEYYSWQRENLMEIFGFDPSQDRPPLPELVADRKVPGTNGERSLQPIPGVAVAVPIKPAMADTWKSRTVELVRDHSSDLDRDLRHFDIRRHASWHQRTANGDLAILYWEVDDPQKIRARTDAILRAEDGYYSRIRDSLHQVFDIDPDQPPDSFPEPVFDYRLPQKGDQNE